jgi:hypothetical protein
MLLAGVGVAGTVTCGGSVIVFDSLHPTAAGISAAAVNTNGTATPIRLLFTVSLLPRGAGPRDFGRMEEGRQRSLHGRLGDFWDFDGRVRL